MRAALLIAAAVVCAALVPSAQAANPRATRDVLVVSNNWAGTADLIDPHTFKRLKRIDVVPDRSERIAEINADPTAKTFYDGIRTLVGEGNDQYVDDGFTSPDGRTVYFSRPSFADVVAINLKTGQIRWRTHVDGYRADHMAITEDGRRLLVSASTAGVVDSIATATGRITARIPAGDQPHENNFSRDESLIFQASIGTVYTDTDDPSQDSTKGKRVFEVIDARSNKVLKQIDMGEKLAEAGFPNMSAAVRPMAITPNERYVYFQVSFFFGIVQYDLRTDKVVAVLELPLGAARGVDRTGYLLDSAHHGLAINETGTTLCAAGTTDDYAAIVDRESLRSTIVDVGAKPYWATNGVLDDECWVSVSGEDKVVVIDYATAEPLASISVGDHPQRVREGVVAPDVL